MVLREKYAQEKKAERYESGQCPLPDVELKHDHLDDLLKSARYHYELIGRVRTHLSMMVE